MTQPISVDDDILAVATRLADQGKAGDSNSMMAARAVCLIAACLELQCVERVFGELVSQAEEAAAEGSLAVM